MEDIRNKLKKLLQEIESGRYGTKNRSELILKVTDLLAIAESIQQSN